jgi:hypothetical protein
MTSPRYMLCVTPWLGLLLCAGMQTACRKNIAKTPEPQSRELTLVDFHGRPVSGASVWWLLPGMQLQSGEMFGERLTNESGKVQLDDVGSGRLFVRATQRFTWVSFTLETASLEWPLRLALPAKLTAESEVHAPILTVTVLNSDGKPIEGANVAWDYSSLHPSKIQWKLTDAMGSVSMRNGEGALQLIVRTEGCSMGIKKEYVAPSHKIVVPSKVTKVDQNKLKR